MLPTPFMATNRICTLRCRLVLVTTVDTLLFALYVLIFPTCLFNPRLYLF